MIRPIEVALRFDDKITGDSPEKIIRRYYKKGLEAILRDPEDRFYGFGFATENGSLTEMLVSSAVHWTRSRCLDLPNPTQFLKVTEPLKWWDMGNGHIIQRLHRLVGLPAPIKPNGVAIHSEQMIPGRVLVHLGVRKWAHIRTELLEETKQLILDTLKVRDVQVIPAGGDYAESFRQIARCEFFVGIPSGLSHLATAMDKKVVCLINQWNPLEVILPIVRNVCSPEMLWLYPQNVHLHELGSGEQVKKITSENLNDALDGYVYPFWSDAWLNMINPYVDPLKERDLLCGHGVSSGTRRIQGPYHRTG